MEPHSLGVGERSRGAPAMLGALALGAVVPHAFAAACALAAVATVLLLLDRKVRGDPAYPVRAIQSEPPAIAA